MVDEALAKKAVAERYQRNLGTVGLEGQVKLLASHVLVVGAGGLGGAVLELLARHGVGYIRVVDDDVFQPHNLNRQLLATTETIGKPKVAAAVDRLRLINDDVMVEAHPVRFDLSNGQELLRGMDLVIDCLDTATDRILLSRLAQAAGIPLIHGAIAGKSGQVLVVMPDSRGLECIYAGEENKTPPPFGNPPMTVALAAALEVQQAVRLLVTGQADLANRLLVFDLDESSFELVELK